MVRAGATGQQPANGVWERQRKLPDVVVVAGQLLDCALLNVEETDAVAVPIAPAVEEGDDLQPRHGTVDAAVRYGIDFAELAHRARLNGRAGEAHIIDLPRPHGRSGALPWSGLPERVILVGVGDGGEVALRRAGAALARATRGVERVLTTIAGASEQPAAEAFIEGFLLAAGSPLADKTGSPEPEPAGKLTLLGTTTAQTVTSATLAAHATWLARDLATVPSNIKNPGWLANRAETIAREQGLEVRTWDRQQLERDGFGALLAVGAGSESEPRLVTVGYQPTGDPERADGTKHVVIVGKGITYDTGGISIKPRTAMVPMKTDMAGAAAALATVVAAAKAQLGVRVTAVLPLAENHFGASSYRPADVLRAFDGTTIEVRNTDAEGRLILADALAYACAQIEPDVVIDIATLTGAASLGLGKAQAAAFTTAPELISQLQVAATRTGEAIWQLPLEDEYRQLLNSNIADIAHVPADAPGAGAITAALFLERFVGDRPWLHLDIAGPARSDSDRHEVTSGATGFGARLLLRLLEQL